MKKTQTKTNSWSFTIVKLRAIQLCRIAALVTAIGFSMAACGGDDDDGGTKDGPQKATYVSQDSSGNKYTLEINESGKKSARSAAQPGDTFKLKVEYTTGVGGGDLKMTFEYSGKVGSAQTSGAQVKLTLAINDETITITIVGTEMQVITGKIVNKDGSEVVNNPGNVTPVGSNPPVGGNPSTNASLDGVWVWGSGNNETVITVSGSSAILSSLKTTDALTQSALDKEIYKVGNTFWRNLKSTGALTWSGQQSIIQYNKSSPTVAAQATWVDTTITMNANGQTITSSASSQTYTRKSNTSLDGVWVWGSGNNETVITVSGSSAILSSLKTTDALTQSALDKGIYKVGNTFWRNLKSTGTLTWSGQQSIIQYNKSSPTVAAQATWVDTTITMNANGQTITSSASSQTYTRQ